MKKVLIVIIVLISFGVIGFGIYYASTHDFSVKKEEENRSNVELNEDSIEVWKENSVTLVDTKEVDGSFIQEYHIIINNLERTLEIEFLYRDNTDELMQSLTGDYNGTTLYAYYEYYEEDSSMNKPVYNTNMVDNSFNENNFSFIAGHDGESYLLIHTNIYPDASGEEDKLFILNENLEFVDNDLVDYSGSSETRGMTIMSTYTNYTLENGETPWYTDDFNACTTPSNCYINVKIEDNKIYYLTPVLNEVNSDEDEVADDEEVVDYGELEERVYTIRDGNLEYEVIKRYKIVDVAGQTV